MLDKSINAMVAAIEIYNKPSFSYREESFSILAINAWELLLKARILQLEQNKLASILMYEKRSLKNGALSKKLYKKTNRAGNQVSVGLFKAYDSLVSDHGDTIDPKIKLNLTALTEIRDNAVHFLNKDFDLQKKVHEIGTACLKNYLNLTRQWFAVSMAEYQLFLMPIAFLRGIGSAEGIILNNEERNLLKYIQNVESDVDDSTTDEFNFAIDVEVKLKRTSDSKSIPFTYSDDPSAVPITLQEESIREKYPWDYNILTAKLRGRYLDFLANQDYHDFRKDLEAQEKFCKERFLDPGNPKSPKKKFYNPNVLREFDSQYTKK